MALNEAEIYEPVTDWNQLPLALDRKTVGRVLGLGLENVDKLFHRQDFPGIKVGRRMIVGRDALKNWLDNRLKGE